jgi:hypothetical protein
VGGVDDGVLTFRITLPSDLLDLARYPVDALGSSLGKKVVAEGNAALRADGVCILPGFLRAEVIDVLVEECESLAPLGHHSEVAGTPYIEAPDRSFPEGHPRRSPSRTSLTAVAYDLFPSDSALRALYEWDPLMIFIGALLDRSPLYRYADPFGALNLAVMTEGDELHWHFDQTDFVVSLAIQSSDEGGDFENAKLIRSAHDERYDDVAAVLDGTAPDRVRTEPMTPGTLMVFEGRNSMHRVTPIKGNRPRFVALLAYDTKPDTDSSDRLKMVRYGRLP